MLCTPRITALTLLGLADLEQSIGSSMTIGAVLLLHLCPPTEREVWAFGPFPPGSYSLMQDTPTLRVASQIRSSSGSRPRGSSYGDLLRVLGDPGGATGTEADAHGDWLTSERPTSRARAVVPAPPAAFNCKDPAQFVVRTF